MPFTVDSLKRFLAKEDDSHLDELLSQLSPVLKQQTDLVHSLQSDNLARRIVGLCRVLSELAYRFDPQQAWDLSIALRSLKIENYPIWTGNDLSLRPHILGTIYAASIHAGLQSGAFGEIAALIKEAQVLSHAYPWAAAYDGNIADGLYEALIHTWHIDEALVLRAARHAGHAPRGERSVLLDRMLDTVVPSLEEAILWEPQQPFSWARQTSAILLDWVREQGEVTARLEEAYAQLAPENRGEIEVQFARARAALARVAEAAGKSHRSPDDEAAIHHQARAFRSALSAILTRGVQRPRTLQDNHDLINAAATLLGLDGVRDDEWEAAESSVISAASWSAQRGDRHGEVTARWTAGLVADRRGADANALDHFSAAFARLMEIRPHLPAGVARAMLATSFRTLIPRLAGHAIARDEADLAFRALEFRRGLGLVEASLTGAGQPTSAPPAGVHYFAISIFSEHGVLATLRTADGHVSASRLPLSEKDLFSLTARHDPKKWRQEYTHRDRSPRPALNAIMAPIVTALAERRIAEGDHLAVALDHPLHMVPIHYLDVAGALAVERFSFSRVASYDDLCRILARDPRSTVTAAAIYIPAEDARNEPLHDAAFDNVVAALGASCPDLTVLRESEADRHRVLSLLADCDVVHLHAHGIFPRKNPDTVVDPVRDAALLVAAAGELPSRGVPGDAHLLRTRDILDHASGVAKHVSLAACVSGLGRPGRGGDMLGLEFALRARGAESVVAAHWDVDAGFAGAFYANFHREWLERGLSRGSAWRAAVLSHLGTADTLQERCAACAFTLYGDWR